ncbi:MAG TPA: type IV pilin N-terminal domain-containing protein [Methanospirillum sp.]|nr:type IV pilin N-terminal domain-containing protein [Methanospirillum sp.]
MHKREDAVSPVIGVILMVAITVILAAVIAAFVFGMAGNVNKTKNLGVVAEQTGSNTIVITNHGGKDITDLTGITVTAAGVAGTVGIATGSTKQFTSGTSGKDHVIATGTWSDGSSQVVLDTYV